MIQDSPFLLLSINAPNTCTEQTQIFQTINDEIKTCGTDQYCSVVMGGDDEYCPVFRSYTVSIQSRVRKI